VAAAAGRGSSSVDSRAAAMAQRGCQYGVVSCRGRSVRTDGAPRGAGRAAGGAVGVPVARRTCSYRRIRRDPGVAAAGVVVAVDSGGGDTPAVVGVRGG